jgi:GAF domain-containing protein
MQGNADNFDASQRALLESIALGVPLDQVLDQIVRLIEGQATGMLCSIMLIDADGRIRHAAAPSMPAAFIAAIDGQPIGPAAGSCGTAAYTGKPVIVADIATDPLWKDYRELALPLGLRACWSTPILTPEGSVSGTFAMYYREVRRPAHREMQWIGVATHLASIAIQSDRAKRISAERRSMEEAVRIGEQLRTVILDSVDDAILYLQVHEG